ncbi:hypothetical protein BsWGS_14470 [Bradybaena similaris]
MANETGTAPCILQDTAMTKEHTLIIIFATTFSAINCFILLANSAIIASITRSLYCDNRAGKSGSISQVLMLSMAFSDLLLGTFSIPLGIYELIIHGKWYIGFRLCAAKVIMDIYTSTVSIYHVTFMAIDRYLAVCRPLLHRTLTMKAGAIMASCSWGLPAAVLLCPLLFDSNGLQVGDINSCARLSNVCVYKLNPLFHIIISVVFIHAPVIFVFILYAIILRAIRQFQLRKSKFARKDRENVDQDIATTVVVSSAERQNNGSLCCPDSTTVFQRGKNRNLNLQCLELPASVVVLSVKTLTLSQVSLSSETHSPSHFLFTKSKTVITSETGLDASDKSQIRQTSNDAFVVKDALEHKSASFPSGNIPRTQKPTAAPTKQNIKAIRTIGLIIICFTLCWMPIGWLLLLPNHINISVPQWVLQVCAWLGYLNSALNPIVYCSNTSIRQAVFSLIFPCCRGR